MSTALLPKATIVELVGHRARALDLYAAAADLIASANEAAIAASPAYAYGPQARIATGYGFRRSDDATLDGYRRDLDRAMWRSAMASTNLLALMDAQERKEFEDALERDPPEFTAETVQATCFRLLGEADTIFRRGLVNAFQALSRDFRSHDGFKIGRRIIIHCAFDLWPDGNGGQHVGTIRKDAEIGDVDRVMHVLDGKAYDRQAETSLLSAIHADKNAGECETPYWRAKWFQRGTLHLYAKSDDLRARANRIIAEHYGAVVGGPVKGRRAA